jgi:hypothetical protein
MHRARAPFLEELPVPADLESWRVPAFRTSTASFPAKKRLQATPVKRKPDLDISPAQLNSLLQLFVHLSNPF